MVGMHGDADVGKGAPRCNQVREGYNASALRLFGIPFFY